MENARKMQPSITATKLRQDAEAQLQAKRAKPEPLRTLEETRRLVHELEVHQIELEMQNAELRRTQEDLELARNKYAELYEFAPVGYFTFDGSGVIRETNLTGAQLLGIERGLLLRRPFKSFVSDAGDRDIFSNHLSLVLHRQIPLKCEISITKLDGTKIHGQLHSAAVTSETEGCQIFSSIIDVTVRKQLETVVQDARKYAENIIEAIHEPLLVLDSALKILTANHSFYETFKVMPKDTIGNFIYDLGNRQWNIPKLRALFEDILPHDTVFNGYEVEHDFPNIGRKIILLNARQIFRENIGTYIILLTMEDITQRKMAAERISEIIRQQQAILDNIPNFAWLKDRYGRYVAVNSPFSSVFKLEPKDLIGKNDYDIYPRELAVKYEKDSLEVMASGARIYFEESIVDRQENIQYLEKIETPIFNDAGVVIGTIGIAHDITKRKEVETNLRYDSTHDSLTGLYNRVFFDEELERLAQSRRFPLSIVTADLNGLKIVNDTQGHEAGDNLIRLAARVILAEFRAEDTVARIGGDEFAVLLPRTDEKVAEKTVQRIMNCPEILGGQVSIAFGIASAESKEQIPEALRLSDERMYGDKAVQKAAQQKFMQKEARHE